MYACIHSYIYTYIHININTSNSGWVGSTRILKIPTRDPTQPEKKKKTQPNPELFRLSFEHKF